MFKYLSTTFVLATVLGCGEPQETSVDANNLVNKANAEAEQTESQSRRQQISNPGTDLTCLQQCGQEARGTIYSDCLDEGAADAQAAPQTPFDMPSYVLDNAVRAEEKKAGTSRAVVGPGSNEQP